MTLVAKQMILLYSYPKDSEKHLLAIRSGLTRSQVCFDFRRTYVCYLDLSSYKCVLFVVYDERYQTGL